MPQVLVDTNFMQSKKKRYPKTRLSSKGTQNHHTFVWTWLWAWCVSFTPVKGALAPIEPNKKITFRSNPATGTGFGKK